MLWVFRAKSNDGAESETWDVSLPPLYFRAWRCRHDWGQESWRREDKELSVPDTQIR